MGGTPNQEAAAYLAYLAREGPQMQRAGANPKRPRDMTDAELEALPTGPFVMHERQWTREEALAGKARGRSLVWAEYPPIRATAYEPDDIFAWSDAKGDIWDFGQWADGTWFKQRSVLS